LLGYNEFKNDEDIQELDLFEVEENNDYCFKNGHILGQKDQQEIFVIDTKAYEAETKINSN